MTQVPLKLCDCCEQTGSGNLQPCRVCKRLRCYNCLDKDTGICCGCRQAEQSVEDGERLLPINLFPIHKEAE